MDLKSDKCGDCNGKGYIKYKNSKKSKHYKKQHCYKCKGTGTIDWIERIVGKKQEPLWFTPAGTNKGKFQFKGGLKIKMGNAI